MDEIESKQSLASGLHLCMALQQSKTEEIEELLAKLYEELQSAGVEIYFATLKNVLSTAVRKRREDLFLRILQDKQEPIMNVLHHSSVKLEVRNFIDFLVFTVCDRRLVQARPIVQAIAEGYSRNLPEALAVSFWNDWTSLIARFARRSWNEETDWLLRVLLHQLWRRGDVRLAQQTIWQLQMHVAMYCRYDGLENTFKVYRHLFMGYMLVINHRHFINAKMQVGWLQVALRGLNQIIMQLARVRMLEEHEVYQAFREYFVKGEDKISRRWIQMLQLCITYWGCGHPKSSRKQVKYLENILQPYYISDDYVKLVEKMC